MWQQTAWALIAIIGAILFGRIVTAISLRINKRFSLFAERLLRRFLRFTRLGLFLASLVVALAILDVQYAEDLGLRIAAFLPTFFVLVLLWLLGYAIISIFLDAIQNLTSHYAREYFQEVGITERMLTGSFVIAKTFFVLIFAAVSLAVSELALPVLDWVILGLVLSFIIFALAVLIYAYKDYVANFLLSNYVQKNVVKPGTQVRMDGEVGEVVAVTNHGAEIVFDSGYKLIIPNQEMARTRISVKRVRSDIHKLEKLLRNYVVQLPSHCGPASSAMMLDFFQYSFTQEQIAKEAGTKVRGKKDKKNWKKEFGTDPVGLINAVKKLTKNEVKGNLVQYKEIQDLKEEVKVWLTEGALLLLWYKKPVLFPEKESRSGHFVLAVGVEDDNIIVMDPSSQTAGVYMVNYELMEEAMAEYDKERGYIVFAKKGSSAYWRLTEGLYYSDVSLYEDLSRSFERYLKKTMRESRLVKEFVSPFVELFLEPDEKVKHIWKPDLGAERRKHE